MAREIVPSEVPITRKRRPPMGTIGSTGLKEWDGVIDEEILTQLRGDLGVRAFKEMRENDAIVGASFNVIGNMVRQVPWMAKPAHEGPKALEAAEFLDSCMHDMEHTWEEFISEVLSMMTFGWAYFEKDYKVRQGPEARSPTKRSQFDDGRFGWRRISIRAQETRDRWELAEDGTILGMWQTALPDWTPKLIPMTKAVLFRTETFKNSPEGRSLLRSCWRSWYFLKRMQEIEAIGIERDLVGLPVLELPSAYMDANASDVKKSALNNFTALIQQIRRNENEGLVIPTELDTEGKPTGFKLRLLSSGGRRAINPSEPITRYEKRIAQTMLTQFLFLGIEGIGSFALSSDMTSLFSASLGSILDIIASTFNRSAVAELMQANGFRREDWAQLQHGDIERQDGVRFADSLLKLVNANVLTPDSTLEAFVREQMQFPPKELTEEGEETEEEEALLESEDPIEEPEEITTPGLPSPPNGSNGVPMVA